MRQDIANLFNSKFDRNEQMELVASTLEHLRATYPDRWEMLGTGRRVPEFKAVVSRLLRAADESVDPRATVAYVTTAVLDELEAMANSRQPRRVWKSDLVDASRFSHEHATPVEVVLRTVALPENREASILPILQALCCRVLVTNEERKRIDGKHAWTVPASFKWGKGLGFGVRTLMPALLPLIRYHEVDPALAFSLVPLSSLHQELLARFQKFMSASTTDDMLQSYNACRREPGTLFELSDDIYRGTARIPRSP